MVKHVKGMVMEKDDMKKNVFHYRFSDIELNTFCLKIGITKPTLKRMWNIKIYMQMNQLKILVDAVIYLLKLRKS